MKIAYSSISKFLVLCEQALALHGDKFKGGINVVLEPGGYEGSLIVTIEKEDETGFETDWENPDVTRFPARIKAAATALRNQGYWGTFVVSHKNGSLSIKRSESWSRTELKASVEAYVAMLQQHHAGQRVVKKSVYQDLAQRFGRTAKSFEYRMQNISYVYVLQGRLWLPGLKPASHVGVGIANLIEELISEVEGKKMQPVAGFETQVKELLKKRTPKPEGNQKPATALTSVTQYVRNPAVKAWVLANAQGTCECCDNPAPFLGTDGTPFLEVHHVRHLADGGSDTVDNTVAICPNCHRELHHGMRALAVVEALYAKVERLQKIESKIA
jgi:5-methylcytosine-specific restriction protein A